MINIVVGNNLAHSLAELIKFQFCPVEMKKFCDGEVKPRIKNIRQSNWGILILDIYQDENINDYLVNFFLLAARMKQSCKKVIGVIPYLPYSRQDKEFVKGEPVSGKIIAAHIEKNLDAFITFNSHNHRLKLNDLFSIPNYNISLFPELGEYFKKFPADNTLVIAPDQEARDFAQDFCQNTGFQYIVCHKKRNIYTNKVKLQLPRDFDLNNKNIIIVDDIIASGNTLMNLVSQIKKQNIKSLSFAFVHGLLVGDTEMAFKKLKPKLIVSTNTIFNEFMKVDCAKSLALLITNKNKFKLWNK